LATAIALGTLSAPNAWIAHKARPLEYRDVKTIPARAVAIVPGAAVRDGLPQRSLAARLTAALDLYRLGRVKAILISGKATSEEPEVSAMQGWLHAHNVPAADVWVDEQGTRTVETMWNAVSRFGITSAVVCTQALYLPRALFLAWQAGIDAVGLALPSPVDASSRAVGSETAKTALAFVEAHLRRDPQLGTVAVTTAALALR
jgi:vancomycin permeability regulator SanA